MATGDVGHFDQEGRLFVDGRDDEMIVSGGENVYPREVEELLAAHAGVLEAAAIGVPDPDFGQRTALVRRRPAGAQPRCRRGAGLCPVQPGPLQGPPGRGLPRATAS